MEGLAYTLGRTAGICFCIVVAYLVIRKLSNKTKHRTFTEITGQEDTKILDQPNIREKSTKQTEYRKSYEPKYLMTLNEKAQFRKLQTWAQGRGLIIFSKARLLDLITPRKNQDNYKGLLWKIQAKHVDFVICDKDIRVKCIVEINDNSHKQTDRSERDQFVSEVLQACGYKVLQTYNINEEQLDQICGYVKPTDEEQV